ncbi:MAG TPA: AAA family ATPase [Ktedonobacteraceae bacterium]|jgi:predicted ATP-dependent endonuclease of OLD family
MKIKVSNLGPIQGPVEFDLKPLTIFIGPNNAGKTWLAYTLAGIFSDHGIFARMKGDEIENISKNYTTLTQTVDELLTTGTATIDICQFADEHSELYFNSIALHAHEWLPEFMSTRQATFQNLEISIKLEETKKHIIDRVLATSLKSDIGLKKQTSDADNDQKSLLSINKRKGQREIHLYTLSEGHADKKIEEKLPREFIEERLAWSVLRILHEALYSDVAILPTERTTFITFQFRPLEKSIALEDSEKEDRNLRPLSKPVAHYLHSVIEAYRIGIQHKNRREKEAKTTPAINEYIQLSKLLEEHILGGKVDFSDTDPDSTRDIVFQPIGSTQQLEISLTSSMVKELSPLVFYLRDFAQPGELLIIDEPEMNLHPKAQVQVLEFLAMLVNAGLHVLITTHSPYMIDHITNLCKADEHTDIEKEAIHSEFFLQDKHAFIAKEKTAVYLVDNGTIIDAMNDELEEDTFGTVSDRIADIYFKL